MEILPNLHLVPDVTANSYLAIDPDGLTLIDAGLPRSGRKILRYIESLGYKDGDLRRILITHADSDHVGGLAELLRASPARVCASAIEAEAIRSGQASRPLKLTGIQKALFSLLEFFVKVAPSRVDETLADGQSLPVLGGLRVVATPGHTPGHLSFFAYEIGVLFCGDSMRCPEGQMRVSQGWNTWDEERALGSAKAQAALGARIVCAGHGPVVRNAEVQFQKFT
jgi:glyoxylase-like metal-dependent hydrolase (beta-lactamase superfamily II)